MFLYILVKLILCYQETGGEINCVKNVREAGSLRNMW